MIGKTLGNFRIVSEIGKGGMGVVYLAEHTDLPIRCAIKSLSNALGSDPHFRERFYQEAQNQALLGSHPNIVHVTNFFEENGQFFLAMEYVDGQDLGKLIKTRGKLSEKEALSIFEDMLKGLEFAHSKGLIHRDIKPSNVLIDKSGIARIMDFGIAILAGTKRLTSTGANVGSPWYMSPEQIIRPHDIDRRSDIYSLGIVLYEMLTGDVPFEGDTDFSIKNQQVNSPAPDPRQMHPEISQELAHMILKAMAKDPRKRFQDCGEFRQCVEEYKLKRLEESREKWPREIVTLIAILCVSIGIFLAILPKDVPKPLISAGNNGGSDDKEIQVQIRSAYNLIQSASEKALLICQEFERTKRKKEALRAVEPLKEGNVDTNDLELLKERIQEHQKNIDEATSRYADFIGQLVQLRNTIVDKELEEYTRVLENKKAFRQIQTTRLIKLHYQQYRDNKGSVSVEMMHDACVQALG